jgi:hypothetical protein
VSKKASLEIEGITSAMISLVAILLIENDIRFPSGVHGHLKVDFCFFESVGDISVF